MTDIQQTADTMNWEVDKKKLPETLNVLTILTFIGCGLGALGSIWSFIKAQSSLDKIMEMQNNMDKVPDFLKKMVGPRALEMAQKSYDNRLPILVLALVGYALCTYGALQMRERKKLGFSIYLLGELVVPIASVIIFIGSDALFGSSPIIVGWLIISIFIILYATQLKHLS
jgi:hypothetical protein